MEIYRPSDKKIRLGENKMTEKVESNIPIEFYMQGGQIFTVRINETQLEKIKEYLPINGGGCISARDQAGYELLIALDKVTAIRYEEKEG